MKYVNKTPGVSTEEVPKEREKSVWLHQMTKLKPTTQKRGKNKNHFKKTQTREWVKPPHTIIENHSR